MIAAAVNCLVMEPISKTMSGASGTPSSRSAIPAAPRKMISSPFATSAAAPGRSALYALERTFSYGLAAAGIWARPAGEIADTVTRAATNMDGKRIVIGTPRLRPGMISTSQPRTFPASSR